MIRYVIAFTFVALMSIAQVSIARSPPRPATSQYLITEGGDFMIERGEGVRYAMAFSVRENLSSPLYATISFDNPENPRSPFVLDVMVEPGQSEILAQSPAIKRIKNGKNYTVEVLLYSNPSRTERVGKHVQKVFFRMPPEVLSALGIELL